MTNNETSRPANLTSIPMSCAPGGNPNSQQAMHASIPTAAVPAGPNDSRPTIPISTPIEDPSGGVKLTGRHRMNDAHSDLVTGDEPAEPDPAANARTTPTPSSLLDPALCLAADILDDLERVRIANENRLRQLTRTAEDSDGETRGFGLDESHPDVARLAAMVDTLNQIEHDATLQLQRQMRRHPLGPWVKTAKGVGDKQAARLLAAIGDPYWNSAKDCPRTVSALWAYCGLHVLPASDHLGSDAHARLVAGRASTSIGSTKYTIVGPGQIAFEPIGAADGSGDDPGRNAVDAHATTAGVAPKRRRGERANWSGTAKMRAYLIAKSCIQQRESPYRAVYDARREHTALTHTDWTPGHSHNDALRVMSKAILRDLWREAKRIHETTGGHIPIDAQARLAAGSN